MLSYNYSGKVVYFETSGALKLAGCQHAWHTRGETRWVEAHLLNHRSQDHSYVGQNLSTVQVEKISTSKA